MRATTLVQQEQLWFLNNLVTIRVPREHTEGSYSLLELAGAHGDAPPLHVHRTEDEVFIVLAGRVGFEVGGERRAASAGEMLVAPRGIPHRYVVESEEGARWLVLTSPGDFEPFVRELSRPAESASLPPQAAPTPEQAAHLAETAARYGIEILGG